MAKYNREASSFKMAIMNSIRVFHGDDEDILWDKVLSDVLDNYYNSKSYGIYDRPKFETPFVNSEGRWEIEECFRIMKTDFEARPVFLQNEIRIKAYFLTCFIALVIYRYLEKALGNAYTCDMILS